MLRRTKQTTAARSEPNMSIKSFDDAHDFFPATESKPVGVLGTLWLTWLAFAEGRAAHHVYEELRAKGVAHADAASRALSTTYPGR